MQMRTAVFTLWVALMVSIGVVGTARADFVAWNEAVNGEFSKNMLAPTPVAFISGDNDVLGTDGRTVVGGSVNPDYFTFIVPTGFALAAIRVLPITTSGGPLSFIAIEAGNQITVPTTTTNAVGLLGWWHFGPRDIGTDILPEMGLTDAAHLGSTGFSPPLGPSPYAMWIQEFAVGSFPYGFDFVVAPVPEPASGAMMLTGIALLVALWRYRRAATAAV